jgi:hypothetical protein
MSTYERIKSDALSHTIHKINSKQIINLSAKSIKVLEEIMNVSNDFLAITTKAQATREKNKVEWGRGTGGTNNVYTCK